MTTVQTKQNVTLAVPKMTLKQAKIIAIERNMSLSKLLTSYIEEIVVRDNRYNRAKDEALAFLESGFALGTGGEANWTREELHERR